MFLAQHPRRVGSSDTSSGETPIHSIRGSPDTCHPGVPRGNARTCLGSLSHPRSVGRNTLVRRPGSCLLTEQTGELCPRGCGFKGCPSCRLGRSCSPKPPQQSFPARTAGHLSRARRARPPNSRRARRHNSPGCTARPGTEAGQRCQRAEARSHAPQEDHSLRRR
jgi:hypothetical protein